MDGRLNLKLFIENPPKGWPFLQGDLNKDKIINELPFMELTDTMTNNNEAGEEKEDKKAEKESEKKATQGLQDCESNSMLFAMRKIRRWDFLP